MKDRKIMGKIPAPWTTTRSLVRRRQSLKKINCTSTVLECTKVKKKMRRRFRSHFDPLKGGI